jgi:hypothetical protein
VQQFTFVFYKDLQSFSQRHYHNQDVKTCKSNGSKKLNALFGGIHKILSLREVEHLLFHSNELPYTYAPQHFMQMDSCFQLMTYRKHCLRLLNYSNKVSSYDNIVPLDISCKVVSFCFFLLHGQS